VTGPSTLAPAVTVAGTVPEGKVADFLTGRLFNDTAEEYVRQNIEKALIRQYRYQPGDCAPEYPIKVGSSRRRVDVAVFRPGQSHKQENLYLLVETKRAGTTRHDKTEGVEQLRSYLAACINAVYGLWTNGDDRVCLAKRVHDGRYRVEEILEIPAAGQSEEDAQRPRRKDLRPATGHNLLFAFRRCHNYIAANEGKQKPEAFWELLKLIFCKIEDERSHALSFYVTAAERTSATAAAAAKIRIERVFQEKVIRKYPAIFPPADRAIDLNPSVIAFVVSQLQNISLLASPVDVKGVAYEEIVGSNLRGDRGEFFTPRNACRMAVQMLNPQPSESVLDPACGTGGFLITAMNQALDYIRIEHEQRWTSPRTPTDQEREELWRARQEYLNGHVFGADLNPALVRAAKMNMVMNNDGSGGLWQANSLASPHRWVPELSARIPLGSLDIVVTNPPFGTNIRVDDQEILSQFDLAAVWDTSDDGTWHIRRDKGGVPLLQKSQPPEILFIERCVQLLREGGRMAIVLPNGILNNPALGYVRQWIRQNTQVLAVVDMARELFQPKNDTQTSMVLLRKLDANDRALAERGELDYPVFMAIAEKVGKDKRGNTIYRRDAAGDDILATKTEVQPEIDPSTGEQVFREITYTERYVDDELEDVGAAYRRWLTAQR
jgi:type I restriction enzyme M protein